MSFNLNGFDLKSLLMFVDTDAGVQTQIGHSLEAIKREKISDPSSSQSFLSVIDLSFRGYHYSVIIVSCRVMAHEDLYLSIATP